MCRSMFWWETTWLCAPSFAAGSDPNGVRDPGVTAAAAHQTFECAVHLFVSRVRMFVQQRLSCQDPAVQAIAALERLGLNERGLHGMRMVGRTQAIQRDDVLAVCTRDRKHARSHGNLIH